MTNIYDKVQLKVLIHVKSLKRFNPGFDYHNLTQDKTFTELRFSVDDRVIRVKRDVKNTLRTTFKNNGYGKHKKSYGT